MKSISKSLKAFSLNPFKRLMVTLLASVFMLVTATACTPTDTAATPSQPVPEASQADVDRAQGNLSDEAINEDVLSKQGPSRARQSNGVVTPQ